MSKYASGTIDANDEVVGPVSIARDQVGMLTVDWTAGVITLQASMDGTNWIAVEDGYGADTVKQITGWGQYRVIGSGTPNAVCHLAVQ